MLGLWYQRIVGFLATSVADVLSLIGIMGVQIPTQAAAYYAVRVVPVPDPRGGGLMAAALWRAFFWRKKGRLR